MAKHTRMLVNIKREEFATMGISLNKDDGTPRSNPELANLVRNRLNLGNYVYAHGSTTCTRTLVMEKFGVKNSQELYEKLLVQ